MLLHGCRTPDVNARCVTPSTTGLDGQASEWREDEAFPELTGKAQGRGPATHSPPAPDGTASIGRVAIQPAAGQVATGMTPRPASTGSGGGGGDGADHPVRTTNSGHPGHTARARAQPQPRPAAPASVFTPPHLRDCTDMGPGSQVLSLPVCLWTCCGTRRGALARMRARGGHTASPHVGAHVHDDGAIDGEAAAGDSVPALDVGHYKLANGGRRRRGQVPVHGPAVAPAALEAAARGPNSANSGGMRNETEPLLAVCPS